MYKDMYPSLCYHMHYFHCPKKSSVFCLLIPLLLFLVTSDFTPHSNHSLYYLFDPEEKLIARVGDWVGRGHFAWESPGHLTAPFGSQAMPSQHQGYSIGCEAGRKERRRSLKLGLEAGGLRLARPLPGTQELNLPQSMPWEWQ